MSEHSLSIEDELSKHGSYASNTLGPSMRPLFKTHRDVVVMQPLDREVKKYDIVLYKDPRGYILHRVVKIKGNTLIIRGDNTFKPEFVEKDRVIARVVSFNRKGKHHTVNDKGYLFYVHFWNIIYPVRFVLRKIRLLLGKIKRKIFK